jgi:hypothetical protein
MNLQGIFTIEVVQLGGGWGFRFCDTKGEGGGGDNQGLVLGAKMSRQFFELLADF